MMFGMPVPVLRVLLVSVIGALLAGCGSSGPGSGSRYTIAQDRAPAREIDIASIPDVVLEPISRTGAGNRSPYTVLGNTYYVLPTEEGYNERGVASWYGEKFHGHLTSNGELFDMYKVSAAHKSLPIPSFVQVTNLDNNRSLIVRVNDRGPFHGERLIDLSYAAALKLGFADRGTARVQLQAIMPPGQGNEYRIQANNDAKPGPELSQDGPTRYLQVGAFADRSAAESVSNRVQPLTRLPVQIFSSASESSQILYRVRIGPIANAAELQLVRDSVVAAGLGSPYTVSE